MIKEIASEPTTSCIKARAADKVAVTQYNFNSTMNNAILIRCLAQGIEKKMYFTAKRRAKFKDQMPLNKLTWPIP
jgi:hypothetical protein